MSSSLATHTLAHSLTHPLAHSPTCSLAHLPTCSLAHSLTAPSLTRPLTHLPTCPLAHLPTHSLAHSLTYSLTHLLTHLPTHILDLKTGNQIPNVKSFSSWSRCRALEKSSNVYVRFAANPSEFPGFHSISPNTGILVLLAHFCAFLNARSPKN